MDGCLNCNIVGWMVQWLDCLMVQKVGCLDECMVRQMMDSCMDGWMDGCYGQMCKMIDGWVDG